MIRWEAYLLIALTVAEALLLIGNSGKPRPSPNYPSGGTLVFCVLIDVWVLTVIYRLMACDWVVK